MGTTDQDSTGRAGSDETADPEARTDQGAASGRVPEESADILTLVCLKCGTEYYFSDGNQPEEMTCDKCGNGVFRSYHSRSDERESEDYDEATHRDLRTDDAEGDTLPGDLLDLDRV